MVLPLLAQFLRVEEAHLPPGVVLVNAALADHKVKVRIAVAGPSVQLQHRHDPHANLFRAPPFPNQILDRLRTCIHIP